MPVLRSVGDFNRTIAPGGNCDFPAGYVSDANPADIVVELFNQRTGPDTFSAVGSLTITDIDGDRFLTGITGTWYSLGPGFLFFSPDAWINPRFESDDGWFNGYNGSFSLEGLTDLASPVTQVNWVIGGGSFDSDIADFALGVSGQLVPAPGAAAMLAAVCVAGATRRRRA
jgi:hypothetical protein